MRSGIQQTRSATIQDLNEEGPLQRTATLRVRAETVDRANRSVRAVLSTNRPVMMWSRQVGEYIDESLDMKGVVLPESGKIPLLDAHDRSSVEKVIGHVRDFALEKDQIVGRLYFAKSMKGEELFALVADGHADAVSVGYQVLRSDYLDDGQTGQVGTLTVTGPVVIAREWQLKEVSLVAVGADPDARIKSAQAAIAGGTDFLDKRGTYAALRDGIILGAGIHLRSPHPEAEKYKGLRIKEAARILKALFAKPGERDQLLRQDSNHRLMAELNSRMPWSYRGGMRERATTTYDLPTLLGDIANKVVVEGYSTAKVSFDEWTGEPVALRNLHPTALLDIEPPELVELETDNQEVPEGALFDLDESIQGRVFARIVNLTYHAIVNDNLDLLATLPFKLGQSAREKVDEIVYDVLKLNAALADGTTLFHADRGNLLTGGALTEVNLKGAFAAMIEAARRNTAEGKPPPLGVIPRFLIVPPALAWDAYLLTENKRERLQPIVSKRLAAAAGGSDSTWYLAADPEEMPTVKVGYLNGEELPEIVERGDFKTAGVKYRVSHITGAAAAAWQGLLRAEA